MKEMKEGKNGHMIDSGLSETLGSWPLNAPGVVWQPPLCQPPLGMGVRPRCLLVRQGRGEDAEGTCVGWGCGEEKEGPGESGDGGSRTYLHSRCSRNSLPCF